MAKDEDEFQAVSRACLPEESLSSRAYITTTFFHVTYSETVTLVLFVCDILQGKV